MQNPDAGYTNAPKYLTDANGITTQQLTIPINAIIGSPRRLLHAGPSSLPIAIPAQKPAVES